jgi:hypothetical protein
VHRSGSTATQKFTVDTTTGYVSIYAGNITSSGSTYDGTGIVFDNDGLRAYVKSGSTTTKTIDINSGGSATFRGTVYATDGEFTGSIKAGSSITGATITGGIINTALTGARITINDTANSIDFYPSISNINPGYIRASTILEAGVTYGKLEISGPYAATHGRPRVEFYSIGAADSVIKFTTDLLWTTQSLLAGGNLRTLGDLDVSGHTYIWELDVSSTIYANTLGVYNGTNGYPVRQVYGSGTGLAEAGYLRVQTSSRNDKKNIEPLPENNYIDMLTKLNPVKFNDLSENDGDPKAIGLIAEEVAEIPELRYGLVPLDQDGNALAVHYELVGVLLIMALKEIKQKLSTIEARLDALEG